MTSDQQAELAALNALLEYIKSSRGFDFTGYKSGSLLRRVHKRMSAIGIAEIINYTDYLEVHPQEFAYLFDDILINVTSFFRDPESWEYIASELIPSIIAQKKAEEPIRVWCAGCASGEESYTVAMLLAEALGFEAYSRRVKIYATDVDESALALARQATYAASKLESLPPGFREKYFVLSGANYICCSELRRAIIFGRHDLVQDAPISRIDFLTCRNTLMYFNAETQARILARFHFALDEGGYLFVGKAEMLLTPTSLFSPVVLKYRIFRKIVRLNSLNRLPAADAMDESAASPDVASVASNLSLAAFDLATTAQVILNADNYLILANQQARSMFNLVMTDIGRPLQDLEISYRPLELRSLIESANSTRQPVIVNKVVKHIPGGKTQFFDVRVEPLLSTGGISISFTDVTLLEKLKEDFNRALQELETTNEELHSAQEELETTNEELQSTNEELETTNEELQSSNEELETMNEELTSTNDELEATNAQLRTLSMDVNQDMSFLESILASIGAAIVTVDTNLNVLTWNHMTEETWGVRAEEAVGKPFASLDIGLPIEQLEARIKTCLAEKTPFTEFCLDAVNRRGRSINVKIRITPISKIPDGNVTAFVLLIDEQESHAGAKAG